MIDETGTTVASTLLPKPPSSSAVASQAGSLVTWWTGDSVMVFDASSLTLRYTIAAGDTTAPLGPGEMMAGKLLVPVTGGIGVYDPVSGANERYIPVDRRARASPAVVPAVVAVPGCSSSAATPWWRWADALRCVDGRACSRYRAPTANVGSGLPDFQCLSSACASSR